MERGALKLVSNAFLAQRSLINSISALVKRRMRISARLPTREEWTPASGRNFSKQVSVQAAPVLKKDILNLVYLCGHYGLPEVASYWKSVVRINEYQQDRLSPRF